MPLPRSWYPYLAAPAEAAALIGQLTGSRTWPPPGTTIVPVMHPEPWALVVETTYGSAAEDDGAFWTTLGEFVTEIPSQALQVMLRISGLFVGPITAVVGTVAAWPVVWRQEKGEQMKWLRATFSGELGGGVEQFQWKLDLGNPGADPTLTEAEQLALAEQLSAIFSGTWADSAGVSNMRNCTGQDVVYTEVGVVSIQQSDAGNSDGSGGTQTADNATQWFAYPSGSKPTGTGGAALPFEVACAVTTKTDHRGASGRGRFYLPPFGTGQMAAGGVFSGACIGYVGDWVDLFFTSIRANTPYKPIVVSKRRKILNEIVEVDIGKVPDSQRRRRRKQDEARVVAWSAA